MKQLPSSDNQMIVTILILSVCIVLGYSARVKQFGFDVPQKVYTGHIQGQSYIFNYSRYVSPKATEVEFSLFIIVGDDEKGKQFGWIRVGNEVDFHYSAVWGNH